MQRRGGKAVAGRRRSSAGESALLSPAAPGVLDPALEPARRPTVGAAVGIRVGCRAWVGRVPSPATTAEWAPRGPAVGVVRVSSSLAETAAAAAALGPAVVVAPGAGGRSSAPTLENLALLTPDDVALAALDVVVVAFLDLVREVALVASAGRGTVRRPGVRVRKGSDEDARVLMRPMDRERLWPEVLRGRAKSSEQGGRAASGGRARSHGVGGDVGRGRGQRRRHAEPRRHTRCCNRASSRRADKGRAEECSVFERGFDGRSRTGRTRSRSTEAATAARHLRHCASALQAGAAWSWPGCPRSVIISSRPQACQTASGSAIRCAAMTALQLVPPVG